MADVPSYLSWRNILKEQNNTFAVKSKKTVAKQICDPAKLWISWDKYQIEFIHDLKEDKQVNSENM